jgi:hypothetical protein
MCLGYGETCVPLTAAAHTASLPIFFVLSHVPLMCLSCAFHVPWVWQNLCTSDFATAHTASFTVHFKLILLFRGRLNLHVL